MKWITLILLTLLCVSCKSVKYVPVETTKVEQKIVEKVDTLTIVRTVLEKSDSSKKDSIRESIQTHVTVKVNEHGDTLRIDREREIVRDRSLKEENNTLLIQNDSLRKVIRQLTLQLNESLMQKPVYIEKEMTKWERFRLKTFWLLAAIVIGGCIYINRNFLITLIKKMI